MQKKWIAGGIVLGVLLTAALVLWIFFPGLPDYLAVKRKYENIDRTITPFETVAVPDDFRTETLRGIRLSVPASFAENGLGSGFRSPDGEGKVAVLVLDTDIDEMYRSDDPWESYLYTEADYRHYFQTVGVPYPNVEQYGNDLLWYWRGTLLPEDVLHLRGTDRKVFLEFAECKEDSWNIEDTRRLALSGAAAYVCHGKGNALMSAEMWHTVIYPDGSGSEYISVMMTMPDETTAWQIISSISYTG